MKRILSFASVLLAAVAGQPLDAYAAPAGTGAMRVECAPPFCCATVDFANATFDVFGNPVNLGSDVGQVVTIDTVTTPIDLTSGTFAGTTASTIPGLLGYQSTGSYLCSDGTCATVAFVGDVFAIGGSIGLPGGATYTQDGTVVQTGNLPSTTIPGCPLGAVTVWQGNYGLNAFQSQATPTGPDVTVPVAASFFDSATGQQVEVSFEVTFDSVSSAGETTIKAFSNAAGTIPGNFAAEVRGQCVDAPATDCCLDSDCPSGTCTGCYRAAFVDVTTTATIVPPIEVCSFYPDADDDGFVDGSFVDEARLRVLHDEGGTFVDRTSRRDTAQNLICAEVGSLSFFLVAAPAPVCPAVTDGGCRSGFGKGLLKVATAAGKEKAIAKWIKGPATTQSELGNPLAGGSGTVFSVCIYDDADILAGELTVDRAGEECGGIPCWKALGNPPPDGKGYKFGDRGGASDGVQKIIFKAGADGKSKVLVKAKGGNLPSGITAALQGSASATIQMRTSDGICLSDQLTEVLTATSDTFKAK